MAKQAVQVDSDGKTVWVNGHTGHCLARFGRGGIDIHRDLPDQVGKGECLFCTHEPTRAEDWDLFVAKVQEHHGVRVARRHRPGTFAK
jgi:hypothetical protein